MGTRGFRDKLSLPMGGSPVVRPSHYSVSSVRDTRDHRGAPAPEICGEELQGRPLEERTLQGTHESRMEGEGDPGRGTTCATSGRPNGRAHGAFEELAVGHQHSRGLRGQVVLDPGRQVTQLDFCAGRRWGWLWYHMKANRKYG